MQEYKNLLKEEVEVLREKGKAFLDGSISRNEFKGFSGGMGSYAQKETGKFMNHLIELAMLNHFPMCQLSLYHKLKRPLLF